MKSTSYAAVNAPIKLHLEYSKMTIGELSNILRHWQALLRAVWRDAYELQHGVRAPNTHVLTIATSTENSLDLISDYALQGAIIANLILGPVTDWPRQARIAYAYLSHFRETEREARLEEGQEQVTITGGKTPLIAFPSHMLENEAISERLVEFWRIANSGNISVTVEEVNASSATEVPDGEAEDHPA